MTQTDIFDAAPPLRLSASRERLKAIGLMCLAVMCFAALDSCAKFVVSSGVPPLEVAWVRYVANAALLLPFVNPWTVPGLFRTKRPTLQIARSLLLFGSTFLNFMALGYLQLTETISILFATPFLVALMAGVLFGQWLGPQKWVAILIGFAGVLVVTRPGLGGMHWAASLSLAGAMCYAMYNLATRALAAHDSTATTVAFTAVGGLVVLTPLMPSIWVTPSSALIVVLMIAAGFFGLIGHWLLILAHRSMSAQDLSPFMYTQIGWMALSGWFVFGDAPGLYTMIGAGIIIASGLYLLWCERGRGIS